MGPSLLTLALLTAATTQAADCDRACLKGFLTQYLDAMLTHNPGTLPVSDKVRFTEDTVDMKLGDGLWKNASKITGYRQDILDVRQGVAASQVVVEEGGMPALLMLRLKVAIDSLQATGPAMSAPPEESQLMPRDEAIKTRCSTPRADPGSN